MLDKAIFAILVPLFTDGLTALDLDPTVLQLNQPTQQGVIIGQSLYLTKLFDHRYGFPLFKDYLNEAGDEFIHEETQIYESHFQASALFKQDPADTIGPTASDIANLAAHTIQSAATLALLKTAGLGVERVTDVRNPPMTDDEAQYEFMPNFDFVLTHKQTILTTTPVVVSTDVRVIRV